MKSIQQLRATFEKCDDRIITLVISLAAFLCYTSMYAFRKSFTAANFDEMELFGIHLKVLLVITQMLGYMLSKFYGIRFISEMNNMSRGKVLITLICISWFGLLGFAITPSPYNIFFMLINGFPLGMIWGLVFSYLEGRKNTELMGATMAVSLVFASGLVKTTGRWLITDFGINEYWMPFLVGLIFFVPFMLCVAILEISPKANNEDQKLRNERIPMTKDMRKKFLRSFLPGITLTIIIYTLLTVLRDVRDNFEVEIWQMLHLKGAGIFAKVDGTIAIIILIMISLLIYVKDNTKAFKLIHYQILLGFIIMGSSTLLYTNNTLDGLLWMILVGLGLYMAYIPYNAIFFERMIATFRIKGNIGFIMYLADSIGYLFSFLVLINKELIPSEISWGAYFIDLVLFVSSVGIFLVIFSLSYFVRKGKKSIYPKNDPTNLDKQNTAITNLNFINN